MRILPVHDMNSSATTKRDTEFRLFARKAITLAAWILIPIPIRIRPVLQPWAFSIALRAHAPLAFLRALRPSLSLPNAPINAWPNAVSFARTGLSLTHTEVAFR
jgi:hypothetical protein